MLVSKFKVIAGILIAVGALSSARVFLRTKISAPAQLPGPWGPALLRAYPQQHRKQVAIAGRSAPKSWTLMPRRWNNWCVGPGRRKRRANGMEPRVTCAKAWKSLASGETR